MKKITLLLLLLSQLSILAQDHKFGKVSKEEIEEKFYPLDSTADAAYLFRKRRTYYMYISNRGFQLTTEIHERIKIYTKEGFNQATKSVAYYDPENGEPQTVNSIKGYTYFLVDNKVEKEKLTKKSIFEENKNKYYSIKKITMPNITEGCVIELKYTLTSPYTSSINDLQFQFGIPVKSLDYRVEIPEFYIFNKRSKGYYTIPMQQESKTGKVGDTDFRVDVFTFNGDNIPALKDNEPYVSNIDNYRGSMKFELTQEDFLRIGGDVTTYSNSWEDVSKKIFKTSSFGAELNKTGYYKDELEEILATVSSDSQKIIAILNFVKGKVKWNGYNSKYTDVGVRKAFKDRVGNVAEINLMLTSMLRFAGLEANPVLVSTRANGVPVFPTLDGFNYVISMVEFNNGSYVLLDATEPFSLPNTLPERTLNWNGRKVTKEGNSSWVSLNTSIYAEEDNNLSVKISEDLIAEGIMRSKFKDYSALSYRKDYNHLKEESVITQLEENYNIEIDGFRVNNSLDISKPILRILQLSSEDLVEEINGKLYIEPLLFLTSHTNPFKLEDRKFPVDFATPWKNKNNVSITIPAGYKVEKLPETIAIGLPDNLAVFKYEITQKGSVIQVISTLQINKAVIIPQYYGALKEFYGKMVAKQSEKIIFSKI
ncbi:DUF3857 domain-containing protein [Polaribacter sargassicola]|uniref:DUF3857 domain-containing protein n=1 Tax=Polaribacter sargassicola TaxID=2836891 RepID=UPI001F270334|nr:DUF3857 domain-containing protein [Polaribacter sp. DS7-9]MCG1036210.1 transglutaminase-like domain-containing protein [Polaribacter sp. DS7-9]